MIVGRKIIIYVLAGFAFLFFISMALSPIYKAKEFAKSANSDLVEQDKNKEFFNNREINSLVKEKTYKEALLNISKNDSIQLVVNLHDSLICLFIKGVNIHETFVKNYKTDALLKNLLIAQYSSMFSKPLGIKRQYATIIKEPIVVRHAPKDTAEAALNAWKPDTLIQNPAFLQLVTENDIMLIFEQENNSTIKDKWTHQKFNATINTRFLFKSLSSFFSLKKITYYPTIKVQVPANDLRAIYRAMPNNANVVICLSN